jgi:hypothetical protein
VSERTLALVLAAVAFILAATANSGGYRYGVSDQAFYATAVVKELHPNLYPRDTPLLEVESNLMWADEIVGGMARLLDLDQPTAYLALYVATLGLLFAAAIAFGRSAGMTWWAVAALLLLLTFRHRIAKTGANSLEGYMHPRMLAFALGVAALAAVLKGRHLWALAWIALAACWHPTTALWFGTAVVVALIQARPEWRRWTIPALGLGALASTWIVFAGPLAGRLVIMDASWLAVLAEKDYLFPHEWPLYAWLINLAYPVIVLAVYRRRRQMGATAVGEPGLVAGLMVLATLFLLALPLTILRLALAVQLQVTRVFWVLDFAVAASLAWWLLDDLLANRRVARLVTVGILAAASLGRGAYLLSQDRQLFATHLPGTAWVDAMTWLRSKPPAWHLLAHPGHAWMYGVSARLAAEKDTLVEAGKDTALAIYDRDIAMSVGERLDALRDFDQLSTQQAQALAERYDLDVVVIQAEQPLDLPILYRNDQFVIYDLQ